MTSILRLGPAMGCSLLLEPTFMAFGSFGSSGSTIADLSVDLFYHGSLTIFTQPPPFMFSNNDVMTLTR